jgi:hypothetical protein
VRLLPALANIYDVVIDGIVDDADNCQAAGTLLLGDMGDYGENKPDSMRNVTISNIICNSRNAISLQGFLTDSVISNVVNKNPNCSALTVTREDGMNNVNTFNIISAKTIE